MCRGLFELLLIIVHHRQCRDFPVMWCFDLNDDSQNISDLQTKLKITHSWDGLQAEKRINVT